MSATFDPPATPPWDANVVSRTGHVLRLESGEGIGELLHGRILLPDDATARSSAIRSECRPLLQDRRPLSRSNASSDAHDWIARDDAGPTLGLWPILSCDDYDLQNCSPPLADLLPPFRHVRHADFALLDFVYDRPVGLVTYGPGVRLIELLIQTVAAFPEARIVILARYKSERKRIIAALRKVLPDQRVRVRVPAGDEEPWVAVVLPDQTAEGDFARCHLVLVIEARSVSFRQTRRALSVPDAQFRLIGFQSENAATAPLERDDIDAAFGFERLRVVSHGRERTEARCIFATVGGAPVERDLRGADLLDRVRRDPVRNQQIAGQLQAIAAGAFHRLPDREQVEAFLRFDSSTAPRVDALVGTVEQAVRLASHLPGWAIVAGKDGIGEIGEEGLSRREFGLLDSRRRFYATRRILTLEAVRSKNLVLTPPDVVAWVGSGPEVPTLPDSYLSCASGDAARLLIVDFADRRSPRLRQWTQARRRQYRENDIFGLFELPSRERMADFLERRGVRS